MPPFTDSEPARRRAVAARVATLALQNEQTLLHTQAFCQAQRLPYPVEVAAIPRVLHRFAADLQDGKRPHEPVRRWWRRW